MITTCIDTNQIILISRYKTFKLLPHAMHLVFGSIRCGEAAFSQIYLVRQLINIQCSMVRMIQRFKRKLRKYCCTSHFCYVILLIGFLMISYHYYYKAQQCVRITY